MERTHPESETSADVTAATAIVMPPTPTAGEAGRSQPACASPTEVREWTAALASGDERAFRKFHEAYFDRLLRYLLVTLRGDEAAAREALQDTFMRVARHVRPFDREDVFWSWLTVLARSAARDHLRQRHRYGRLLGSYASAWFGRTEGAEIDADEALHAALQHSLTELPVGAGIDRGQVSARCRRAGTGGGTPTHGEGR